MCTCMKGPGSVTSGAPKVIAFVDWENLHWGIVHATPEGTFNRLDPVQVAASIRSFVGERYGIALREIRFYADFENDAFRGVMSQLQRHMVVPRHVFSKVAEGGTIRKNACDIAMSVDMVVSALRQDYDIYVVVSGDRDLCHAIEVLRREGKHVHVLAFSSFASRDLLEAFASEWTALETIRGLEHITLPTPPADPFEELRQMLAERGELPLRDSASIIRNVWALELHDGVRFVGLKKFHDYFLPGRIDRPLDQLVRDSYLELYRTSIGRTDAEGTGYTAAAVRVNLTNPEVREILDLTEEEAAAHIARRNAPAAAEAQPEDPGAPESEPAGVITPEPPKPPAAADDCLPADGNPFDTLAERLRAEGKLPLTRDEDVIKSIWLLERHPNVAYVGKNLFEERYLGNREPGLLRRLRASGYVQFHTCECGKSGTHTATAVRVNLRHLWVQDILGIDPDRVEEYEELRSNKPGAHERGVA